MQFSIMSLSSQILHKLLEKVLLLVKLIPQHLKILHSTCARKHSNMVVINKRTEFLDANKHLRYEVANLCFLAA